jgi:hypothetical protein
MLLAGRGQRDDAAGAAVEHVLGEPPERAQINGSALVEGSHERDVDPRRPEAAGHRREYTDGLG